MTNCYIKKDWGEMKKKIEILINQQFWRWWSGDLQGGDKMDEKYKTETFVIRYYKKAHKKGFYCKGT